MTNSMTAWKRVHRSSAGLAGWKGELHQHCDSSSQIWAFWLSDLMLLNRAHPVFGRMAGLQESFERKPCSVLHKSFPVPLRFIDAFFAIFKQVTAALFLGASDGLMMEGKVRVFCCLGTASCVFTSGFSQGPFISGVIISCHLSQEASCACHDAQCFPFPSHGGC